MRKSTHTRQYQKLREALTAAREAAGLSQHELARRLGRPQSFVSKCESGERRLDVVELVHIFKLLRADPVEFVKALSRDF
ncbi:MAG: helix-turn-helix transcriptional regulator [Alphaproteobacteria bacterium]|nr:helix-turn-helix transcriptional regulator [Alphaproteobacteria bacterium]